MRLGLALGCLLIISSSHAAFDPPPEEADEFHFVVLGDAQFDRPQLFNRIVDQTRRLRPSFVIQVGDLIDGYKNDLSEIRAEWDRFGRQISPLDPVRFIAVPGNHDVYNRNRAVDARLEQIFTDRWGPLYFSFRYKNAEFIVLNSDSTEQSNGIAGRQLEWLRETLKQPAPRHRFVFLHRPPLLMKNARPLHELFKGGSVSHVFYGHHHHYHFLERDGIAYIMTNASGNSVNTLAETGGMPHLLQVAVRGEEVNVAPIMADAIFAHDAVDPQDNYDFYALNRKLAPRAVKLEKSGPNRYKLKIPLHNTSERAIQVYAECSSADQRWIFTPQALSPQQLSSGKRGSLAMEVSFTADRVPESEPECALRIPFQTRHGRWIDFTRKVKAEAAQFSR